jgi:hypothetical protein
MNLLQIPSAAPGEIEHWLIPAAALLSIAALWKKVFPPRRDDDAFATKAELNQEIGTVRDKIDARFLTLGEKIEVVGTSIHTRLNQLESGLARVDERTKK